MSLNDADVADLAREVVDRVDPTLNIRIDPAGRNDPYRFGADAWTVHAAGRSSYLRSTMSRQQALDRLVADLIG